MFHTEEVTQGKPKPAVKNLGYKNQSVDLVISANSYWICNINGDSYYLMWNGAGWVVRFQESYLCRNGSFEHKNDIPSFDYSHIPMDEPSTWKHVFDTKEEALQVFLDKHKREESEV